MSTNLTLEFPFLAVLDVLSFFFFFFSATSYFEVSLKNQRFSRYDIFLFYKTPAIFNTPKKGKK